MRSTSPRPLARARPTVTGKSSSRVRSGDAAVAGPALQFGDARCRLAATTALIGVAGIGEPVTQHPPARIQRRLDDFAHQLRRDANISSSSVSAARPRCCGSSTMARTASPTDVPPGSRVCTSSMPRCSMPCRNPASKVLLPAPSPPSRLMNFPRAEFTGNASAGSSRHCDCVLPACWKTHARHCRAPRSTARYRPPDAAPRISAGLPGIAIGVGGRPSRV